MAQAQEPECGKCQAMKQKSSFPCQVVVFSKNDLIDKQKKRKLRKEKEHEFLRYVNAFMNNGGGIICLHVRDPNLLNAFEQTVNRQMAAMIPDDTTFHENFERHIIDKNHVIFRVKSKSGMLSTLSFNTKIQLDIGVEDPTPGQMRHLMRPIANPDEGELYKHHSFTFTEQQPVEVKITKENDPETPEESVFQEGRNIQAKRFPDVESTVENTIKTVFFDEEKFSTYLPKYISAFVKQPQGGSIFLGIREEKESSPKWSEVEGDAMDQLITLNDTNYHLWKNQADQYFLAKECQMTEVETGKFVCEGITLTPEERIDLPKTIEKLIREKMLWRPHQGEDAGELPDLVTVQFLTVEGNPDKSVLEINVKKYDGTVFYRQYGPEAHKVSKETTTGISKWM